MLKRVVLLSCLVFLNMCAALPVVDQMLANTATGFIDAGQGVASGIKDGVVLKNVNLLLKTLLTFLPPGMLREELQSVLSDFMELQVETSAGANEAINQLKAKIQSLVGLLGEPWDGDVLDRDILGGDVFSGDILASLLGEGGEASIGLPGLPVIDSLLPLLMQIPEEILGTTTGGENLSYLTDLLRTPLDAEDPDGLLGLGLVSYLEEILETMLSGELAALSSLTQIPLLDSELGSEILNVVPEQSLASTSVQRIMQLLPLVARKSAVSSSESAAKKSLEGAPATSEEKPDNLLRGDKNN